MILTSFILTDGDKFEKIYFRTILPELEKCQSDPRRLKSMFEQRRVRFKTVYGKFCLNNPKSEYIINNHEKYFTVSHMYKSVQGARTYDF